MIQEEEKNKSISALSYSKSIVLSNGSVSKKNSCGSKSCIPFTQYSNDMLKETFKGKVKGSCPIHICLTWLSINRGCLATLPSDIVADHYREKMNKKSHKFKQTILQKILALFKFKITKAVKVKVESMVKKGKRRDMFLPRLNFNTNKPCCNSNIHKENSDDEIKGRIKYLSSNLSKTYTQDYGSNLSSHDDSQDGEKSTEDTNSSEFDSEHLLLKKISKGDYSISKIYAQSDDQDPDVLAEESAMPNLITNRTRSFRKKISIDSAKVHDGKSLYGYLAKLFRKCNSSTLVPKNFNICYKFYIYMYPSTVDTNLLLFQRHELKSISKFMDPFDVNQLIEDTKSDFLFDRRLRMIQNKSNCHIVLQRLNHIFINGLPHREIKIFSNTYENIARALTIMEDVMPHIMETSVFKDYLPITYASKWSPKNIIVRPVRKSSRVEVRTVAWMERLDPDRRFSSYNFILNDPKSAVFEKRLCHKSLMIAEENNENVGDVSDDAESLHYATEQKNDSVSELKSHSNLSNIYCEIAKEGVEAPWCETDTKNSNFNVTSNFISTNSVKYHYLKRIKCPATILKSEIFRDECALNFLFDKFHCNITKVDEQMKDDRVVCNDEEQIKITVVYNTKNDLQEFCRALGLCIKLK